MYQLQKTAKQIIPESLWNKLRAFKRQQHLSSFKQYVTDSSYNGIPFKIWITDGMSQSWYDPKFVGQQSDDQESQPEIKIFQDKGLTQGSIVFDVGAHQAVVASILGKLVGEPGKVVAVEAEAHNVKTALTNKELNDLPQLEVVHAAISNAPGVLQFSESLNGSVSKNAAEHTVEVKATTLDVLAQEFGQPNFVLIDVEGYEQKALEGAPSTIEKGSIFIVEVHTKAGLEEFGGTVNGVVSYFSKNYDLHIITPQGKLAPYEPNSAVTQVRFHLVAIPS